MGVVDTEGEHCLQVMSVLKTIRKVLVVAFSGNSTQVSLEENILLIYVKSKMAFIRNGYGDWSDGSVGKGDCGQN